MKPRLDFLDRMLRRGSELSPELATDEGASKFARQALLWIFLLGGIYGLCMGSFALFHGSEEFGHRWQFALSSAVKVPLLLLFTAGLCFPALYIFGIAGGAKLKPRTLWAIQLAALLVLTLLLVALAPVVLFFLTTVGKYKVVKIMQILVWSIAGISSLRFFGKLVSKVDPELAKNHRLLIFWMAVFALVGSQMGWMLRPFIGNTQEPFRITRDLGGSFLGDVFKMLG
jgi:hypothetical protein